MAKIMYKGKEYSGVPTSAENIAYDNSESGLSATNVQSAIDEVNDKTKVEKITLSITTSAGTLVSADAYKVGNVVRVMLVGKNTSAVSVGSNVITGKFNNYLPILGERGIGVSGSCFVMGYVNPNGNFALRVMVGTLSANTDAGVSFTYLTNEQKVR